MHRKNYLEYILNPLDLLRTKKVLHVNPTIIPERKETIQTRLTLFEYDKENHHTSVLHSLDAAYPYLHSPGDQLDQC
jgi:magnesium transporter